MNGFLFTVWGSGLRVLGVEAPVYDVSFRGHSVQILCR